MSGNTERISTDQVLAIANELDTYNKRLNEITSEGKGFFEALSTHWTGEASQKSFENFSNFADRYKDLHEKTLNSYIDFLKVNVSQGYEETESDNINLADAYLDEDSSAAGVGSGAAGIGAGAAAGAAVAGAALAGGGATTEDKFKASIKGKDKLEYKDQKKWKYEDGKWSKTEKKSSKRSKSIDASIGKEASISGSIAKTGASASNDWADASANVEVGKYKASASGTVSLVDENGHIRPHAGGKVGAEFDVVHGDAGAHIGDGQLGAGVDASASVGHVEASAEANAGVWTNEDGKTEAGVKAKAGAVATAVQGDADASFSILGVKITGGVSGYAGAIGAEAGASVTTSGVECNIGAAVGIGVNFHVGIDPSELIDNLFGGFDNYSGGGGGC